MSESITTRSLKDIFRFPFQEKGWQQSFLIGSGLFLLSFFIPILPIVFIVGYTARLLRHSIEGQGLHMPRWDDLGEMGLDGLRVAGVSMIYTLPGILVYGGGILLYLAISFLFPLTFSLVERADSIAFLWPMVMLAIMLIFLLAMVLGFLLILVGSLPLPIAIAHMIAKGKFSAAFHIREWGRLLRRNWLGYFVAWVVIAGLGMIVYIALIMLYSTIVLCITIPFVSAPLLFYLSVVHAALFGQTYRECLEM